MNLHLFKPRGAARVHAGMSLHAFLTRLIWLCVGPLVLLAAYLASKPPTSQNLSAPRSTKT
jgi:hypothetical protein